MAADETDSLPAGLQAAIIRSLVTQASEGTLDLDALERGGAFYDLLTPKQAVELRSAFLSMRERERQCPERCVD